MTYATIDLENLRQKYPYVTSKSLFPHQTKASDNLNKVFDFEDNKYKAGLLVFPTGGGKTFTAVKWICDNVLPKNIKVVWLAHSYHLLDQAYKEFKEYALWIGGPRKRVNIRIVSSNPAHCNVHQINDSDDIVIMTTPSAISNYEPEASDTKGKKRQTNFHKYLTNSREDRLLIVIDEAHHVPAYGCRNLILKIKEQIPKLYLLGLTATPTYTDETRRGWLYKIFEQGIIYEAKRQELQLQKIIARENYIQKQTNFEMAIDDKLYNRLMREHKDLPENIIESLAANSKRNDFIIQEYLNNRDEYGKTIIFADRWHQCVYLKAKLIENGVKADAVYSHIDADPGSTEARNKRKGTENSEILEKFRNDKLDVLINVRMLTEGTDVPNTKTVFVTRDTTSHILLTQMIGRGLRGEKAGGGPDKKEANIVFFADTWKGLINWASPIAGGGLSEEQSVRGYYPLEMISIRLVEELTKQINSGIVFGKEPFLKIVPTGWYETEYVINNSESGNDQLESFVEYVLVYSHTAEKYDLYIQNAIQNIPDKWAREVLDEEWSNKDIKSRAKKFFNLEEDDMGKSLIPDLIRVTRHIAQKKTPPRFVPFEERENYDVDDIAKKIIDVPPVKHREILDFYFSKPDLLWKVFYKTYDRFKTAVDASVNRLLNVGNEPVTIEFVSNKFDQKRELTEEEKEQVKKRDSYTCLCCGSTKARGIILEIDHILPLKFGGATTIDNSQTLCRYCNSKKAINEINFRYHETHLTTPKKLEIFPPANYDYWGTALKRIVNFFYHCSAMCKEHMHVKKTGRYYNQWGIELYKGNDPEWLRRYEEELIEFAHEKLGQNQVERILIR